MSIRSGWRQLLAGRQRLGDKGTGEDVLPARSKQHVRRGLLRGIAVTHHLHGGLVAGVHARWYRVCSIDHAMAALSLTGCVHAQVLLAFRTYPVFSLQRMAGSLYHAAPVARHKEAPNGESDQ